jgi:Ser/Thr protein kinase RdoA (MazF antagonist)
VPDVAALVTEHWDFPVRSLRPLSGGRNARAWRVCGPAGVAVAKLVGPADADLASYEGSLRVAAALDAPDLPTGAPIPGRAGTLTVPVGTARLALLRWLPGHPPTTAAELAAAAAALATVHDRTATMAPPPGVPTWPWSWLSLDRWEPLDPGDPALVAAARDAVEATDLVLLHGDPTPDNIRVDGPTVGLLDWATVMQGPPAYDLAVLTLTAERAGLGGLGGLTTALIPARRLRLAAELVWFTSRADPADRVGLDGVRAELSRWT